MASMGLNGGSKCMYISSKLTAKEVYCILKDWYNDSPNFRRPTVDIDANEIAFRYINSAMGLCIKYEINALFSRY